MSNKFIWLLLAINLAHSQANYETIADSLKSKSYEELIYNIYTYRAKKDTVTTLNFSRAYLKKALKQKDSMRIAEAYHYIGASTFNEELTMKYLDTSLIYSKNHEGYIVPASTYLTKSVIYSKKSNYKKALNNFLLAYSSAKRNKNRHYASLATYNIAVIKSRIGLHEEALDYAKKAWNYKKDKKVNSSYLWTLTLLSNEYINTGDLKTSTNLNKIGIKKSLEANLPVLLDMFVFLEGINAYYKKNYSAAIDSIKKTIPTHIKENHKVQLAVAYLYLGKTYYDNNEYVESISNFRKVDSIFLSFEGLLPRCREAYDYLIKDAKKKEDLELELYYTNQLLKFDNSLQKNYQYISSTIYKEHETPILLEQKDKIISKLTANNNRYSYYIIFAILISIIIFIFLLVNYKRRKKYKNKFEKLIKSYNDKKEENIKIKKENTQSLKLDEKIVERILIKLENFENEKLYLRKKISLNTLSKDFDINSKYISQVINHYKEKTVSQYINSLRLNYCINRLKNDEKFRKYTLEYIASECGFNTRRSFNIAFLKETGISPSFFIDKLST